MTPTADGSALVFAETQATAAVEVLARRVRQAGTVTPLVVNLPGHPDNISTGADGRIWVRDGVARERGGGVVARRVRRACASCCGGCPTGCSPQIKPEVWAVAFDPDSGEAVAGVRTEHPVVRHW